MLMAVDQSQNALHVLEQAQMAYQDSVAPSPPIAGELVAQRARHFEASVDPGNGQGPAVPSDPRRDDEISQFANHVVTQMFSVGLRLHNARRAAGPGPVSDELLAAAQELDDIIRNTRVIMYRRTGGCRDSDPPPDEITN